MRPRSDEDELNIPTRSEFNSIRRVMSTDIEDIKNTKNPNIRSIGELERSKSFKMFAANPKEMRKLLRKKKVKKPKTKRCKCK